MPVRAEPATPARPAPRDDDQGCHDDPGRDDAARRDHAPHDLSDRTTRTALAALTLLAAVLRCTGLGRESLWVDEGYTKYLATLSPSAYLDDVRHTVRNILPPLYFTLEHVVTAVLGDSETALRLPSAVAGVLAVPLLHALLARLFDRTTGLLGAGLLAVSPFHLHYAQEARMYALLALLCLASAYLLVRLLAETRTWQALTLAATEAAVVWTHHYGVLVLVAEAGFVAVLVLARDVTGRALRRWLVAQGLAALLVLPWALLFVDQLHKVGLYPWLPPVTAGSVLGVLAAFAGSGPALAVTAALLVAGAWAARGLPRRLVRRTLRPADRGLLLLWSLFAVPVLAAVGYSVAVSPVFGRKYLIASSVALLALAAVGARTVGRRVRTRPRAAVAGLLAALVVAGLGVPQAVHERTTTTKEQWREATALVERRAAPGDVVLFNAGYTMRNGFGAYATRDDLVTHPFPLGSEEFSLQPTAADLDALPALVAGRRHAFVVYSQSNDPGFTIADRLGALADDAACTDLVGVSVCRYDLRSDR